MRHSVEWTSRSIRYARPCKLGKILHESINNASNDCRYHLFHQVYWLSGWRIHNRLLGQYTSFEYNFEDSIEQNWMHASLAPRSWNCCFLTNLCAVLLSKIETSFRTQTKPSVDIDWTWMQTQINCFVQMYLHQDVLPVLIACDPSFLGLNADMFRPTCITFLRTSTLLISQIMLGCYFMLAENIRVSFKNYNLNSISTFN